MVLFSARKKRGEDTEKSGVERRREEERTIPAHLLSTMGSPPNTEACIPIQVAKLLLSGEK